MTAVYDRKGTLLDKDGTPVADSDPQKFSKAVHLSSIHMDIGMHCVDCHFGQDAHGNGHIYGEVAAAIEIDCADCHGTADKYPALRTSGPASQPGVAALEVDTALTVEKNPAESVFHVRAGRSRVVTVVRVADRLLVEVDKQGRIAGLWFLDVPPFPNLEATA